VLAFQLPGQRFEVAQPGGGVAVVERGHDLTIDGRKIVLTCEDCTTRQVTS
jgi:hypothetical protein